MKANFRILSLTDEMTGIFCLIWFSKRCSLNKTEFWMSCHVFSICYSNSPPHHMHYYCISPPLTSFGLPTSSCNCATFTTPAAYYFPFFFITLSSSAHGSCLDHPSTPILTICIPIPNSSFHPILQMMLVLEANQPSAST